MKDVYLFLLVHSGSISGCSLQWLVYPFLRNRRLQSSCDRPMLAFLYRIPQTIPLDFVAA